MFYLKHIEKCTDLKPNFKTTQNGIFKPKENENQPYAFVPES